MRMKRENRGLTLVELMITIAILAIVIAAATSFMVTGSKSFTKGSADSDLQKEAELTVNQIEDMVIDVNGGLDRTYEADADGNKTKAELVMYHATQEEDELGTVETKYVKETVVWKKSDEKMYYSKWDVTYDSSSKSFVEGTQHADNQLLAERVSLFEVDLDTVDETTSDGTVYQIVRAVQIRVGYENSFGDVEYATSPTITLRNRMLLTDDPNEAFEVPQKVSAKGELWYNGNETGGITVIIIDQQSEVSCGNDYQIYARLKEEGKEVNDQVNWEIETECSSNIDATGILHVGASEPNEFLTIVARKKTDSNEFARGVVKVVGTTSSTKSFRAITITRDSLEPFSPSFDSYPTLQGKWSNAEINEIQYTWSVSAPELLENYDSIDKNKKTFAFNIKKERNSYGRVFEIRLTAYAPATGETRSDKIQYRIDEDATDGGDSFMKRGMMEHGDIQFWFDTDFGYDVTALSWEYYFCDINGNRIPEYDYLLPHVVLGGNIGDNYGNHHFNYTLAYDDELPLNHEYYVKVVTHMKDPQKGTEWDHERIFYIPAVQLFDSNYYGINDAGWFWCYFDMIGYWNVALQDSTKVADIVGVDLDDCEVEWSAEGTKPEWVAEDNPIKISLECYNPVARADVGPNGMRLEGRVINNCMYWQKVTIHSIKLKVYMKKYPDVYTYINMYFD